MSNKILANSYPGTRDFYPEDMRFRSYMFSLMEQAVAHFAYEKISGPLLENFEIYAAKSGEEIAEKQLYVFTDKGDRRVAIRPELTPTIARMYAAKINEIAPIQRWYSIENFMRYERPQKGRLREFYQFNIDMIGANGSSADFELLAVAQSIFDMFGATKEMYSIKINNRQFVNDLMAFYVALDDAQIETVSRIVDKKDKISPEKFKELLSEEKISSTQIEKINSLFGKDFDELYKLVPESKGGQEIQELLSLAEQIFQDKNPLCFDVSVVRGLAYYTGLVFEAYDSNPENPRALFGGGRYDNLISLYQKNSNVSGVGFAIGDVTFEAFLRGHNLVTEKDISIQKHMIAIDSELPISLFYSLSGHLKSMEQVYRDCEGMVENIIASSNHSALEDSLSRVLDIVSKNPFFDSGDKEKMSFEEMIKMINDRKKAEYRIEIYPDTSMNLGKQLKYANKAGIDYVWICGTPELQRGIIKRKNMETGLEVEFDLQNLEVY